MSEEKKQYITTLARDEDIIYSTRDQMQIDAENVGIDWDGMMCFTQLQDIRGYIVAGSCVLLSPNDGMALMNTLEHALGSWTREKNMQATISKLSADVERIGHERDQMVAANVDLQERLSRLEDDHK